MGKEMLLPDLKLKGLLCKSCVQENILNIWGHVSLIVPKEQMDSGLLETLIWCRVFDRRNHLLCQPGTLLLFMSFRHTEIYRISELRLCSRK